MRTRISLRILPLLVAPFLLPATASWSQPRPGIERPEGAPPPPPPAKMRLAHWLDEVEHLQWQGKIKLDKSQARRIVAVVLPWKNKKTMTEAQAQKVQVSLDSILTEQQKKIRSTSGPKPPRPPHDRKGPDGGPKGHRPDGDAPPSDGPPPGGGPAGRPPGPPLEGAGGPPPRREREAMRGFMESNNPFNNPRLNAGFSKLPQPEQELSLRRYRQQTEFLKSLGAK